MELIGKYKIQDAAETYPAAIWPAQAQRALRSLIRAWHQAREDGQGQVPAAAADPLIFEFRHAVLAGLSDVPRVPGPKNSTAQHPSRDMLEFCHHRQAERGQVSRRLVNFASGMIAWGLFPLMLGICIDIYLIALLILQRSGAALAVACSPT